MGEDKRRFERVQVSLSLLWRTDLPGARWMPGTLLDLGAGGLRFECEAAGLSPSGPLEFQITLPTEPDPYRVTGKIVWERPIPRGGQYGVSFVNLSMDQQADLDRLVDFLRRSPLK